MEPTESAAQEAGKQEQPEAKPEPLWKERPFDGGKLFKYAEQAGIDLSEKEDEEPAAKPEEKAAPVEGKKPCPNCPPDEKTVKAPDSRPEKEAEPYATLKINGKDVTFKTKENYDDYIGKSRPNTAAPKQEQPPTGKKITRLSDLMKQGQPPAPAKAEEGEEADLDLVDPAIRSMLEKQKKQIEAMNGKLAEYETVVKSQRDQEITQELQQFIDTARKKHPLEDLVDDDADGFGPMNRLAIAGVVNALIQDDLDNDRPEKGLGEYFEKSIAFLSKYQGKIKGNGKTEQATEINHESLLKSHPDLVQEIREAAVADYLRERGSAPPAPKSKSSEAVERESPASPRKKSEKGLREVFEDLNRGPLGDTFAKGLAGIP